MIVVTNRLRVAPGFEAEFEKRFGARARLLEETPGFVDFQLLRPLAAGGRGHAPGGPGGGAADGAGGTYAVRVTWESLEAFQQWTRSEAFRRAHAGQSPEGMFSGPSELEIHEVVS